VSPATATYGSDAKEKWIIVFKRAGSPEQREDLFSHAGRSVMRHLKIRLDEPLARLGKEEIKRGSQKKQEGTQEGRMRVQRNSRGLLAAARRTGLSLSGPKTIKKETAEDPKKRGLRRIRKQEDRLKAIAACMLGNTGGGTKSLERNLQGSVFKRNLLEKKAGKN